MTDICKIASILEKIAETHGVTVAEMRSDRRLREFVEARTLVAQELYKLGLTQREVAKIFHRDLSTMSYHKHKHKRKRKKCTTP